MINYKYSKEYVFLINVKFIPSRFKRKRDGYKTAKVKRIINDDCARGFTI